MGRRLEVDARVEEMPEHASFLEKRSAAMVL